MNNEDEHTHNYNVGFQDGFAAGVREAVLNYEVGSDRFNEFVEEVLANE